MRSIAKVFGRSPFIPLQTHMDKVADCIAMLPELFEAYYAGDTDRVAELAKIISKLEHDADLVKHDIRRSLPRGLFMPVDRANLLGMLSTQDGLADLAENIGVLLTFKKAKGFEGLRELFDQLLAKCLEAFNDARAVISELDELLETGFGGAEAQKVIEMVDLVAVREYEADLIQRDLLRSLLAHEDEMSYGDFFLWTHISRELSRLADRSDNLAALVRNTLDAK